MKKFRVKIDHEPDLVFEGKLLAFESSKVESDMEYYSQIALYQTKAGKYVCEQELCKPNKTRHLGQVCNTLDEVKAYFKQGWLAKQLYAQAKIDNTVHND